METGNWGTIYACSIEVANEALALQADSFCAPFAAEDDDFAINTNFDHWKLVSGGSGKLVRLQTSLVYGWVRFGEQTRQLRGCTVELELSLKVVNRLNSCSRLTFDFSAANDDVTRSAPGLVTPVDFQKAPGEPDWSAIEQRMLCQMVAEHLVFQHDVIDVVLAEVDVRNSQRPDWACPVELAYSYVELGTGAGYLCVFGGVDKDAATDIDPLIFGRPSPVYTVLSNALFVQHVLMPSLPAAFGSKCTAAHLTYNASSNTITNTKVVPLPPVNGYEPQIDSLVVSAHGEEIKVACAGSCDLNFLGVSMTFKVDSSYALVYDAASGNVGFKCTHVESSSEHYIPWGVRALFILGLGPAGIAITLVMEMVVPAASSGIANALAQSPGLQAFTNRLMGPMHWIGETELEHHAVYLDGALVVESRPGAVVDHAADVA